MARWVMNSRVISLAQGFEGQVVQQMGGWDGWTHRLAVRDATSASLYFYAPVRLTVHAPDFILSHEERKFSEWKALFIEGQIPDLSLHFNPPKNSKTHSCILSLGLHFEVHKRIWLQHFCGEAGLQCKPVRTRLLSVIRAPTMCTVLGVFFSACRLLGISAKAGCTSRACLCWRGGIETLLKVQAGCCLPLEAWITSSQKDFPLYTACTHARVQTLRARHTQLQFYNHTESSEWIVVFFFISESVTEQTVCSDWRIVARPHFPQRTWVLAPCCVKVLFNVPQQAAACKAKRCASVCAT